ncbi:MAG: T9SS type A sorting domain-containing protein [Bacteroidales bacterium]|nr:T9SS type A sorting domain-containing protein [Bacteroidales bacterium]
MKKILSFVAVLFAVVAVNAQVNTFPYTEGFENGFGQWEVQSTSTTTWGIGTDQVDGSAFSGTQFANCTYDESLAAQDEKLISPTFDFSNLTQPTLSFWTSMSYYWGVDPYSNYHLVVAVSTDGGATYTDIWDSQTIGEFENFQYFEATPDISNLGGQSNVKIRFSYLGQDGAQIMLDDIAISGTVGIEENNAAQVSIFPNPATSVLNVNAEGYNTVEIVNLLGQVVYSANAESNMQINVKDLTNGAYFVRMNGANGTTTQKFIKK